MATQSGGHRDTPIPKPIPSPCTLNNADEKGPSAPPFKAIARYALGTFIFSLLGLKRIIFRNAFQRLLRAILDRLTDVRGIQERRDMDYGVRV